MRKNEQLTKTVENWTFPKNITIFIKNEGIAICSQKLVPWKSYSQDWQSCFEKQSKVSKSG